MGTGEVDRADADTPASHSESGSRADRDSECGRWYTRTMQESATPLVGIIMGSRSDWETMRHVAETLDGLGVPYEVRVTSVHRTPELAREYATSAESRGLQVIVAGAGGAAHLPGMTASWTVLPVLG